MTEAQLSDQVVRRLDAYGYWHWHDRATNTKDLKRRNKRGLPDRIIARAGVVKGLELKTERGRVSPEQAVALEAFGENGHVIRPSDLLSGAVDDLLR